MRAASEKLLIAAVEERLAKIDALLDMAQRMLDQQQGATEGTVHAIVDLHERVTRVEAWRARTSPEWTPPARKADGTGMRGDFDEDEDDGEVEVMTGCAEAPTAVGAESTAALTKLLQWTLDNVYTIARREANRDDPRGRWGHVLRLCEKAGCQGRGVFVDESCRNSTEV